MAYILMGNDPITRASNTAASSTFIDTTTPAPGNGILKSFSFFAKANAATVKVKIFRDDGTNFLFITELSMAAIIGLNTFPCWIPIRRGDLIGWYTTTMSCLACATTGGTGFDKVGNITADSAKNLWNARTYLASEQGKVFSRVAPY